MLGVGKKCEETSSSLIKWLMNGTDSVISQWRALKYLTSLCMKIIVELGSFVYTGTATCRPSGLLQLHSCSYVPIQQR